MRKASLTALIVTLVLIAGTGLASLLARRPAPGPERVKPAVIRATLEISPVTDTSKALLTGYHYHLLKRFAADNGQQALIRLAPRGENCLDSLRAGAIDILVVPYADSLAVDSVLVSLPVDSLSRWLMRGDDPEGMRELNDWISAWHASEEHVPVRESYMHRLNAFRSGPRAQISPYDSLIRLHADSLGWDWHLLAAVIYQESRFHIEVRSKRGAAGLMQMMPRTAAKYGVTDPLDPEMNIAAGAQLLGNLIKRYYNVGDNMTERYKYALAAYNAGIGRIDDCISLARYLGVDPSYWDNIVTRVLPLMSDEGISLEGIVKLGPFKGSETSYYVGNTISVYQQLCRICP